MKTTKRQYLFISLLIILVISCGQSQNEIALQKHFNTHEIKELKATIAFFDSIVQQKTATKDVALAYTHFLKKLSESESPNDAANYYAFKFNRKLMSQDLFNKIWTIEENVSSKEKNTTFNLHMNIQGAYVDLLESEVDLINKPIENYCQMLRSSGGISPSLTATLQHYYAKLDFNNELHKLLVALHYITLNG